MVLIKLTYNDDGNTRLVPNRRLNQWIVSCHCLAALLVICHIPPFKCQVPCELRPQLQGSCKHAVVTPPDSADKGFRQ